MKNPYQLTGSPGFVLDSYYNIIMKETEEKKIKSELEAIIKRINKIVKNIDELSPAREKETENKLD